MGTGCYPGSPGTARFRVRLPCQLHAVLLLAEGLLQLGGESNQRLVLCNVAHDGTKRLLHGVNLHRWSPSLFHRCWSPRCHRRDNERCKCRTRLNELREGVDNGMQDGGVVLHVELRHELGFELSRFLLDLGCVQRRARLNERHANIC